MAGHRGTGREYIMRRLLRDAPDLHAQVIAGELSAHAAGVQAGFQIPRFTVCGENPRTVAAALRRRLPPEVLAEVAVLIVE